MSAPNTSGYTSRELRRLAKRAERMAPERTFDKPAPLVKLVNAIPHEPGEKAGEHIKTRAAFDRLRDATADTNDFDHVAMVINMAKVRALEIDATLADMLERGQDAMARCKERYYRLGRFGFDGPGLCQVLDAIDASESIIDASSPLQMRAARNVVTDQLLGKGAAKRLEQMAQAARSKGAA